MLIDFGCGFLLFRFGVFVFCFFVARNPVPSSGEFEGFSSFCNAFADYHRDLLVVNLIFACFCNDVFSVCSDCLYNFRGTENKYCDRHGGLGVMSAQYDFLKNVFLRLSVFSESSRYTVGFCEVRSVFWTFLHLKVLCIHECKEIRRANAYLLLGGDDKSHMCLHNCVFCGVPNHMLLYTD